MYMTYGNRLITAITMSTDNQFYYNLWQTHTTKSPPQNDISFNSQSKLDSQKNSSSIMASWDKAKE